MLNSAETPECKFIPTLKTPNLFTSFLRFILEGIISTFNSLSIALQISFGLMDLGLLSDGLFFR